MQDPSTGVAEVSFPKKIKGTRDFKFLDDDLQARTQPAACLCCIMSLSFWGLVSVLGCIRLVCKFGMPSWQLIFSTASLCA